MQKKKEALAVAEGDNLSLAIGKKGQNVRLAARLTHYRIDVKTKEQVKEEKIDLTTALSQGVILVKQRKIPMRTCVITREKCEKKDLIRVVKDNLGNVSVDITGKKNGHGAYLKKDANVINSARKSKILEKYLDVKIDDSIYEELINIINE